MMTTKDVTDNEYTIMPKGTVAQKGDMIEISPNYWEEAKGLIGSTAPTVARKQSPRLESLNKKIDALKVAGVCDKGIAAVRDLVGEITGVDLKPASLKPKPVHRAGSWYRNNQGNLGLLAQVGYGVMQFIVVSSRDANRTGEPLEVARGCRNVTEEEFEQLVGKGGYYGYGSSWKLIPYPVKPEEPNPFE
jgi:hypothetical protein